MREKWWKNPTAVQSELVNSSGENAMESGNYVR